jgi:acyl carrier protein
MREVEVEERLRSIMETIFECDLSKTGAKTPRESIVGWDSLNHLQMVMAIESEFGVRFTMEQIPELGTIAAVREAIWEQL